MFKCLQTALAVGRPSWAIAAGAICLGAPFAQATSARTVEFRGKIDYQTFEAAAAQGASVRIKQSPGGTGAAAMMLARVPHLVIDGTCNSACAWAFIRSEVSCFTPRAVFGFHGAHDPGTGKRLPAATNYWLDTVRPTLRVRLSRLKTSSAVIRVSARQMLTYYRDRACTHSAKGTGAKSLAPG